MGHHSRGTAAQQRRRGNGPLVRGLAGGLRVCADSLDQQEDARKHVSGSLAECLTTESCASTGGPQLTHVTNKQCPFVPAIPLPVCWGLSCRRWSTSTSSIHPHKPTRTHAPRLRRDHARPGSPRCSDIATEACQGSSLDSAPTCSSSNIRAPPTVFSDRNKRNDDA